MRQLIIAALVVALTGATPTIPGLVDCAIKKFGDGVNTIEPSGMRSMYDSLSHSELRHLAHKGVGTPQAFMEKYGTQRESILTFVNENVDEMSERHTKTLLRKFGEAWCEPRRLGISIV